MPSLYQLSEEIENLLLQDETSEEDLQRVFGDIQASAENACKALMNLKGDIACFKEEEARLNLRRKAMENREASIKNYLKENMERLALDKLKAGSFNLAIQNNSQPSLIIESETKLPQEFYDLVDPTYSVLTDPLKEALKGGLIIEAARIERGKHLRVR